MKQETIDLTYELVDEIKNKSEYKRLIELKKMMEEDPSVNTLINDFNKMKVKYEEVLKFGKYHPDLKDVQKAFSKTKETLYNNEVVQEYKKLEKVLQSELDNISREIATSVSKRIKHPNELGLINKH